ncbi:DNA polymerase delta small subunit Cdc1 [Blastocladiella emersonii ATCC 22665]|nr:DNA polymerase delta small subunit Cdc1 [Blastocladiella emersonii ATCC 22665]
MTKPAALAHASQSTAPRERTADTIDVTPSVPFVLRDRTYTQQYANIYFNRLTKLRPAIVERATARWRSYADRAGAVYLARSLDIKPNVLSWFVGTICCEYPLKPSILDDVAAEYSGALPPPKREKVVGDEADKVAIEDEFGRVRLEGPALGKFPIVTGVVAAVLGTETSSGGFEVVDMCFAGMSAPAGDVSMGDGDDANAPWIGFVSGLHCGSDATNPLALQLLADTLAGEIGSDEDVDLMSRVSRLFVLGNSLESAEDAHLSELDDYLSQIAASMPVTLLPGAADPATHTLPQQAIHPACFPKTATSSAFQSVTNPLVAKVSDYAVAACAGQPLDDAFRYIGEGGMDRATLAAYFVEWRHLAPSAPDTLWCYPYRDDDPFVVEPRLRVLAFGNQPEFASQLIEDVENPSLPSARVVLVPAFQSTGTLVLVNLGSLEVRTIEFSSSSSSP